MSRDKLKQLAVFIVDNTYRIISQLTINDNYTRSFFTSVISFLWDKLQDKGVDLFYVLDNELRADRFNCAVELFKLTGMAIVTPSVDGRNLDYDEVERQIKDHMASLKMIMYIEKDAQVNYIEKVLGLAEGTSYLRILRNKAPDDPNIVVFDQ